MGLHEPEGDAFVVQLHAGLRHPEKAGHLHANLSIWPVRCGIRSRGSSEGIAPSLVEIRGL
jgi:hypothetical protein